MQLQQKHIVDVPINFVSIISQVLLLLNSLLSALELSPDKKSITSPDTYDCFRLIFNISSSARRTAVVVKLSSVMFFPTLHFWTFLS